MHKVKVVDDEGRVIRVGQAREDEPKGFTVRYELLSIICIMVFQLLGGMWWASATNTNLLNMKAELAQIKIQLTQVTNDRYSAQDAARVHDKFELRMERMESRMIVFERQLTVNASLDAAK